MDSRNFFNWLLACWMDVWIRFDLYCSVFDPICDAAVFFFLKRFPSENCSVPFVCFSAAGRQLLPSGSVCLAAVCFCFWQPDWVSIPVWIDWAVFCFAAGLPERSLDWSAVWTICLLSWMSKPSFWFRFERVFVWAAFWRQACLFCDRSGFWACVQSGARFPWGRAPDACGYRKADSE